MTYHFQSLKRVRNYCQIIIDFMAVKVLIFAFFLCWVLCQTYPKPSNATGYVGYTVEDYKNYMCDGDTSCKSQYPGYSTLTWTPATNSKLWANSFWLWRYTGDLSRFVSCRQDFFPFETNLGLCKRYDPLSKNTLNNWDYCQANTWASSCAPGSTRFSAWLNKMVNCCAGNGEAITW